MNMVVTPHAIIAALRRRRSLLLKSYVLHVGSFTSTCAFAATGSDHGAMLSLLWMALVTIPPVLFYTILVDRSCRKLEPDAHTIGLWKMLFITVLLTPLESSLVLPVKNLLVSGRVLRRAQARSMRSRPDIPHGPR